MFNNRFLLFNGSTVVCNLLTRLLLTPGHGYIIDLAGAHRRAVMRDSVLELSSWIIGTSCRCSAPTATLALRTQLHVRSFLPLKICRIAWIESRLRSSSTDRQTHIFSGLVVSPTRTRARKVEGTLGFLLLLSKPTFRRAFCTSLALDCSETCSRTVLAKCPGHAEPPKLPTASQQADERVKPSTGGFDV